ncbi:MAG: YbhB/YbcL family Raf kinase inhibitor-like protein [Candidatus Margulisiibacteriota bacterium]
MIKKNFIGVGILVSAFFFFGIDHDAFPAPKGGEKMQIISSAFTEGSMITAKYTCDGRDISPPLEWKDVPDAAKSFALISDDPDAPVGTWVHWVIYNIPPNVTKFDENMPREKEFKNGMRQGSNDWPKIGYGGPCPPSGTHRYYFKLYALDMMLNLKPGATKAQLVQAMKGHILAEAQLMGKYSRQK